MMFKIINSKSDYNFIGKRKTALIISMFLILISIGSFALQGLNWGIDFSSGYVVQLKFDDKITVTEVRKTFESNGINDAIIQSLKNLVFQHPIHKIVLRDPFQLTNHHISLSLLIYTFHCDQINL